MEIEETKPLVTEDQFRVSTKIVRDLSRYERKRHIAARIIARLKTDHNDMREKIETLNMVIRNLHGSMDLANQEIAEQDIELGDLRRRLADEQETIACLNEEKLGLEGEITALKWVIEKKI